MQFFALDVETANSNRSSICQIGIAKYVDGKLIDEWSTLVDPEDYFDPYNISIHKIQPSMVEGQPKFKDIANQLKYFLEGNLTVSHGAFDRVALGRAHSRYGLDQLNTVWLDTVRVARRAWKDSSWGGFGLSNICKNLGYQYLEHDALSDAKAAAFVLLNALEKSQQDLSYWMTRVNQPINPSVSTSRRSNIQEPNPDGYFFGEVIVFTGTLELVRSEAAELAASIGFTVGSSVTKKTTLLVIGDQDLSKLHGNDKSTKQRKAEELITSGVPIRVISESDFKELIESTKGLFS